MPLDTFVPQAAFTIRVVGDSTAVPGRGWSRCGTAKTALPISGSLERFAFYERAALAFAVVATGETRICGNILLKKGVVLLTSQRARACQGFTQQILSGGIRPGQFISQRELVTLLDMPLGAVREMIPRLEAGGLIKTVPKRGLQIAHVDLKLIRNAFQVRIMIEREAVLNFVHTASDAELDAIEASHRSILARASALTSDPTLLDDTQATDWGLHDLVDALGNEIVSEIYQVNSLRVRLIKLEHSVITPARLIRRAGTPALYRRAATT